MVYMLGTFKKSLMYLIVLIILINIANAHVEDLETLTIDNILISNSLNYIFIVAVIVVVLTLFSIFYKNKTEKIKWLLFIAITIPIILATFYLAGSTIYLNIISETKGPIHWHADFEVYICDEQIDIINPSGTSNKIGSPLLHEHGDNRIHIEGVVVDKYNIDLHNFFRFIGGELTGHNMIIPTDRDIIKVTNGDKCNSDVGKLQAFVYKTENGLVKQEKLINFENYIISPESLIPPGDCIIIEFGKEKDKTKHICETYRVALKRGDVRYGS